MNTLGMKAERKAANYLINRGYTLIGHNFSTRFGEIDLIFEKKKRFSKSGFIVFAEVKMRNNNSIASPKEFVDLNKQRKIIACASEYLAKFHTDLQPRFDVIEVFCENNEIKSINHLENAFTLD